MVLLLITWDYSSIDSSSSCLLLLYLFSLFFDKVREKFWFGRKLDLINEDTLSVILREMRIIMRESCPASCAKVASWVVMFQFVWVLLHNQWVIWDALVGILVVHHRWVVVACFFRFWLFLIYFDWCLKDNNFFLKMQKRLWIVKSTIYCILNLVVFASLIHKLKAWRKFVWQFKSKWEFILSNRCVLASKSKDALLCFKQTYNFCTFSTRHIRYRALWHSTKSWRIIVNAWVLFINESKMIYPNFF